MPETNDPNQKPAELLKTNPMAPETPGAGGWTPGKNTPVIVAVFCGVAGAMAPVLMMPEANWRTIVASALSGASTALVGYFGIRSAGPRQS